MENIHTDVRMQRVKCSLLLNFLNLDSGPLIDAGHLLTSPFSANINLILQ